MIRKVFPILALSMFSSILGVGVVIPLLPIYAENLGATGIWLGVIFAGYGISSSMFTPVAGRLSDHRGRKLFLSTGLFCYSIISLGYIWADSAPILFLIRLMQGLAGAMIVPIAQAYVADLSPKGEEGKWMGLSHAAFFSGFGFGPILGGVITDHFGMTVAFSTMSGLNLLAFFIVVLFLPEIIRSKTRTRQNVSYLAISQNSMVRGIFSFRLTQAIARGGLMTFLPIFTSIHLGLNTTLIGILVSVNVLSMSLLSPLGGKIADRYNRRALTVMGSFTFLACLVIIPFTNSFWQMLVLSFAQGIGGAISIPAATALNVEEGRKYGMGSTMAVFAVAMSLGMIIGPLLAGVTADLTNVNWVFYLGTAIGLIGTSLFIWFSRSSSYESSHYF